MEISRQHRLFPEKSKRQELHPLVLNIWFHSNTLCLLFRLFEEAQSLAECLDDFRELASICTGCVHTHTHTHTHPHPHTHTHTRRAYMQILLSSSFHRKASIYLVMRTSFRGISLPLSLMALYCLSSYLFVPNHILYHQIVLDNFRL